MRALTLAGFVGVVIGCASARSAVTIEGPPASDTVGVLRAFGKEISGGSNGRVLLYSQIPRGRSELPVAQQRWGERLTRIAAEMPGITLMPPTFYLTTLPERLCLNDYIRSFHGVYAIQSLLIAADSARIEYSIFEILNARGSSRGFEWGGARGWYIIERKPDGWRVVRRDPDLFEDGDLGEREPPGYVRRMPSKVQDCKGAKYKSNQG